MSFGDIPLLNVLQQKMTWLNDRQSVLSRNIANASTPGFVPGDLAQADFGTILSESALAIKTTSAKHIAPGSSESGAFRVVQTPGSQSSPDGNSVVVEEQMMKVAETQMAYAEASGLYKKMIAMWRTALGGSHG